MPKLFCLLLLSAGAAIWAGPRPSAQDLALPEAALKDETELAKAMPDLARKIIASSQTPGRLCVAEADKIILSPAATPIQCNVRTALWPGDGPNPESRPRQVSPEE